MVLSRSWPAVTCLLTLLACTVTPEDIETWKGTQKGPGKIVAVLISDRYPADLRTRAAVALIEMNREDVNGLRELEGGLARIPPGEKAPIVAGVVARIREILATQEDRPSALTVRAKDASYVTLQHATGSDRDALSAAVLAWLLADFNGRFLIGENSTEKIVRVVGAPAVQALIGAIRPEELALEKIGQLIVELGDPAARLAASSKLVEVARAQAATEAGISDFAFLAMKALGGRPVVDFVLSTLCQAPAPTDAAAREKLGRAQLAGLAAIEGHVGREDGARLVDIGMAERLPLEVRDQAFDRLADLKDPSTITRLWPLLLKTDQRLRWRAGELILTIGGAAAVPEFLRKLPSARNTEYLQEELGGYADRICEMQPPPVDAIRPLMVADSWVARFLAIRVIGRLGGAEDTNLLRQLTTDTTRIPGAEGDATVGAEARLALERLSGRGH